MRLIELGSVLPSDDFVDIELLRKIDGKTFTCVESYMDFPKEYAFLEVLEVYSDDSGTLTVTVAY